MQGANIEKHSAHAPTFPVAQPRCPPSLLCSLFSVVSCCPAHPAPQASDVVKYFQESASLGVTVPVELKQRLEKLRDGA